MALTPQNERKPDTGEPAPESKPMYWLTVMLVLGALVGWLYVEYGDLETAWDEAGDWIFWILIAVAWILPVLAQLLQKLREPAGETDVRGEDLKAPGKHGTLPAGEMPDDRPIRPR